MKAASLKKHSRRDGITAVIASLSSRHLFIPTSLSSLLYKRDECKRQKHVVLLKWIVFLLEKFCVLVLSRVSSISSAIYLSSEFYLPLFSPSIAFHFHPSQVKKQAEIILDCVVILKSIIFTFKQGIILYLFIVNDSSNTRSVSPTLSPLPIHSLSYFLSKIIIYQIIPNHPSIISEYPSHYPYSSSQNRIIISSIIHSSYYTHTINHSFIYPNYNF